MLTYILFGIILIYILLVLNANKGDMFYPPVIVLLSFALSLSFVIIEMHKWDGNITWETFIILLVGLSSYLGGAVFAEHITTRFKVKKKIRWDKHSDRGNGTSH